jgi:rubrerythrin
MPTFYSRSELIDIAKQVEACGEAFYEAGAQHLGHPAVRELFAELRTEEIRHAHLFEQLLARLGGEDGAWRDDEQYVAHMRALAENRVFPTPEAARAAVSDLHSAQDAVRVAIGFEKDTILFFHELRPMLREADQGVIDVLMAEERRHIAKLDRMLSALAAAEA